MVLSIPFLKIYNISLLKKSTLDKDQLSNLYADDTQLFLPFRPPDFDSSVTHLQNALQHISCWMTASLLTLYSSKTEFLLIGLQMLQMQLTKIHNCSLNTTDSARNLGFIFDSHLTVSDQISSLSKSCYYHIRELRVSAPLDFKTASTIATSIVHSKLGYCNSLYCNLPKSQTNRLQVIQNSFARAVVKAPKFCHVTPIPKSQTNRLQVIQNSFTTARAKEFWITWRRFVWDFGRLQYRELQ